MCKARHKVWKFGGARSTVVGMICPPGWDRVDCLAKNSQPASDGPVYILAKTIFCENREFQISCQGARRSGAATALCIYVHISKNNFLRKPRISNFPPRRQAQQYSDSWLFPFVVSWKLKVETRISQKVSTKGEFYYVKPGKWTGKSAHWLLAAAQRRRRHTEYAEYAELSWSKLRENYFKKPTAAMMSNFSFNSN